MIKEEDYLKAKQIVQEYEKQLNISGVMCRYCISLMYDKTGFDIKGRHIDYKIKSMIVQAQNEEEAKIIAEHRLKDEMKDFILCVDTVVQI